jgi:hypothetical protein
VTALGYACIFVWLTTTPAGAVAVHGRKITERGHQRYYETKLHNLHWIHWGSGSPETQQYIEKINKTHAAIWKNVPGAFSHPWEAQMAVILLSWYEQYMRKEVGAKNEIHPQLKKAWPAWGERITGWFRGEPRDGSQSYGINYPRNFDEIDATAQWFIDFDFDDQRTQEDVRKSHETAESFISQFCELWFPRYVALLHIMLLL